MVPYSQNGKQIINRSANYVIYGNTTSHAMNQVEVEVEGYNCLVGSDFVVSRHMADEEESRTNTNTITTQYHHNNEPEAEPQPEPEPEAGSTSKDEEEEEGANNNNNRNNWLQLSIGFHQTHAAVAATTTKHDRDHHHHRHHRASSMAPTSGSGLVELDLLPAATGRHLNWASSRRSMEPPVVAAAAAEGRSCCQGGSSFGGSLVLEQTSNMSIASGPTFGHRHQQQQQHHQEIMNWAFGSSYFPPPFHFPSSGFDHQFDVAGPSSHVTVRVVDPPPRPHSGIWFMLQASQNQAKEPFLPQIPKNYLRIKDGRMTVRLLLKYLVSKLRLENESEIEITCRGQQLLPFFTLQHVRDNIWTPRDTTRTLLSDSSTTDHVMVLHYGRSTA
ncbi:uncharacterized protein LOC133308228 [Gastrolobium bilobum]|uniref:uncharacterized protein LOC133308228 n=1 Tax=Gastrolobium bilobum TaxID=150636 RepID=UPI002AB1C0F7|nr:uncharacterized protein LOC133308228 [Gastrolobium bilobum]